MTTIFGYNTIQDEVVGLINAANADYNADFTSSNLKLTLGDYDTLENRQYFTAVDLSGRYFGVIDDLQFFKRNFQTLFKGITIYVQVNSGSTNREILTALCNQQGLPPFTDNDFATGLLDLVTEVGDTETLINWPIQTSSWGWTGNVTFYLRNTKSSLTTLLGDGNLSGIDGIAVSGLFWGTKTPALNGIILPNWNHLDDVITQTYLDGLEYPGDTDFGQIITVTELDGLYYPTSIALDNFTVTELDGLYYPPTIPLDLLNATLSGLNYFDGFDATKLSAYPLTYPIDFSDYSNAISSYRRGSQINDASLVNIIVGKILSTWPTLNTESNVKDFTVAFKNATVQSISTVRSPSVGWTVTVVLNLSSHAVLTGNAVLRYDIETFE